MTRPSDQKSVVHASRTVSIDWRPSRVTALATRWSCGMQPTSAPLAPYRLLFEYLSASWRWSSATMSASLRSAPFFSSALMVRRTALRSAMSVCASTGSSPGRLLGDTKRSSSPSTSMSV